MLTPAVPVSCVRVNPVAGKPVENIVAVLPEDTVFQ